MKYFAHSFPGESEPSARWQELAHHLIGVGERARDFARDARPHDSSFAEGAYWAGVLHDLGKYREEFQKYIRGNHPKNDRTWHKQSGAAFAAGKKWWKIAFAILGHHGGIPESVSLKSSVKDPDVQEVLRRVWEAAVRDCSLLGQKTPQWEEEKDPLTFDLQTRFLFSCLVDADWQDTGAFEASVKGRTKDEISVPLDATQLLQNLQDSIRQRSRDCKEQWIADIRSQILEASLQAAEQPSGLFSLSVPTGGGKTFSGLAFALRHAAIFKHRRIIYVAPYLTILEQNARAIRKALKLENESAVIFEHHSLSEPFATEDDEKETTAAARRAENWESPIVLTSNVQFFESLFSNRPGACRKLHNIARSVIILDECQTLPPGLVAPTCSMLNQVSKVFGCTMVLCTATQPSWNKDSDFPEGLEEVREIIPADFNLFEKLRRVKVEWPLAETRLTWAETASLMVREKAALCIVNTRKAARDLFAELRQMGQKDLFHLSTSMCPAHRLKTLDEVRKRLSQGNPCFLVSTQLIECGCDVDFPLVLREIAPLEAIIQSAGRCNREGSLKLQDGSPGGRVIVFRSIEGKLPCDRWYHLGRGKVEQDFLANGRKPDIENPADILEYFRRLYRSGELDQKRIQDFRKSFSFSTVAELYRLIEEETTSVVITTWQPKKDEIGTLLTKAQANPNRHNLRQLGPYQVNLRAQALTQMRSCLVEGPAGLFLWTGPYDASLGISPDSSDVALIA